MAGTQGVKDALAKTANGNGNTPMTPEQTVRSYLERMAPEIKKALPRHMDANRLARIALTTIRTTPKLLECDMKSLMGTVMMSAQLGLEPGILGHCYIVPYGREATFILGYRGMIDLARRSGNIKSIYAHAVRANDEFDFELGLDPKLRHKPALGDRGDIERFYAVAHFKDGGYQFEVMSVDEVEEIRQRSKASNNGPWKTDYEEMGKKTVIRRMFKYLPISVEIMRSVESRDETIAKDVDERGMINVTPGYEGAEDELREVEPPAEVDTGQGDLLDPKYDEA